MSIMKRIVPKFTQDKDSSAEHGSSSLMIVHERWNHPETSTVLHASLDKKYGIQSLPCQFFLGSLIDPPLICKPANIAGKNAAG